MNMTCGTVSEKQRVALCCTSPHYDLSTTQLTLTRCSVLIERPLQSLSYLLQLQQQQLPQGAKNDEKK